jgi:mannose-6-phosphate isomerase-like protein (cupin superfamily)
MADLCPGFRVFMSTHPHITLAQAKAALEKAPHPFVELLQHGSLSVEYYAPKGQDNQTPHDRDELYIIASGEGYFQNGTLRHRFTTGDALFVPAGQPHRFEEFSPNFATWVIFYGPVGGEANQDHQPAHAQTC